MGPMRMKSSRSARKWRAYALRSLRNIMVQLAVVLTALGPRRTRRVPMTSSERLTFQFFVLSVHVYSRCIKALPRHRVAFTVVDHCHGHHTRFRTGCIRGSLE